MADNLPDQLFPQQCGCADCEAAVSPAAYLAALLDYVLKHVRYNKIKFDLKFLDNTFHQPFSELPTDCEAVNKQVRQVRICVEMLRSYLGKRPLADPAKEAVLAKAEQDYRFAVYSRLLGSVGTSYEEIRRSHKELPETRLALAERLGIDLTQPRPADPPGDELDQLFLDPSASPSEPHVLTELVLETLYGLADTTRDPLSEAAKLGDDLAQMTHWNLSGAEWGQNTDPDGKIYVNLFNPAANVFRVELYKDSPQAILVASGQIATASGTVKLVSENNSRLTGVVEISYTADSSTISIAAIPLFLTWQLKHLRTLWAQQDHPTDVYSDDAFPKLPLIDPDLIGPDDFRHPTPKINPADLDKAFDIWLNRRKAIDKIFQDFKTNRESNGLNAILQQVLGNPLPDLDGLQLTLTKGATPDEINAAKDSVLALGITIESFTQLMAMRAKDQLTGDPRNDKVTEAEWGEVYAILTQVTKVQQFEIWQTEEKNIGLLFGIQEFWFALTEPKEGDWPPLTNPAYPFIDPSITKLADLPDTTVGKAAITLWKTRTDSLTQIPILLKTEREKNGFDAMLRLALGNPNPGDALQYDLETLKTNLASSDQNTQDNATNQIEYDLHLTVDNFKRLMVIKAIANPTAAEWAEVYTILTPAHKVKHEYPAWLQQEQTAGLVYWTSLKAKLPRWRSSPEARLAWQQGLRIRSQRPIIDPTVTGADDLQIIVPGNPVFDLWKARYDHGTTVHDGLRTTREVDASMLDGLEKIIKDAIELEAADVEALDLERENGQNLEMRLAQYNLDNGGFTYLMRIRGLAKAGEFITDSEWEVVYATLAQSKIQREFAAFRKEESDKQITLSADSFKIPAALLTPLSSTDPSISFWLSTWQVRRDWQDTLQTRIDQQNSSLDALRNAINSVEESTLPLLRDALILSSDATGAKLEEQSEWITERLLLDARVGGCQITTRVEQAIETLQTLLYALRTGQFKQLQLSSFSLVADNFDEEWKWIGSYAPWRAATFVTLYPENILQPSLLKYQTQAFQTLIANTSGLRLNPDSACTQADTYSNYFRDVCSLEIEATCQASTIMYTGEGCDRQKTDSRLMFYMFGRATSGKIYWSAYDVGGASSAYGQTFWREVTELSDNKTKVVRIIGAMPYRKRVSDKSYISGYAIQTSFIHLFFLTSDGDKQTLKLARLNLDEFGAWDENVQELPSPPVSASQLEIVPVQTQSEFTRPTLVLHKYKTEQIYCRSLNSDGTDWDQSGDWPSFLNINDLDYINNIYYGTDSFGWKTVKAALNVNAGTWLITVTPLQGYLRASLYDFKGGGKDAN